MEDKLNSWELVGVVAQEKEPIVVIQMFMQQLHDGVNHHFNHIALFYQLSGLETTRASVNENLPYWGCLLNNWCYQCGNSEDLHRQSSDGNAPLVVINDEVLLQLLVVLK